MRCTKSLGDKPSERMFNADEKAYFELAVSEAMPECPTEETPAKNKMISSAKPSTSDASPLTENTNVSPTDDVSFASHNLPVQLPHDSKAGRGIKRPTRGHTARNADTTSKYRKTHRENPDQPALQVCIGSGASSSTDIPQAVRGKKRPASTEAKHSTASRGPGSKAFTDSKAVVSRPRNVQAQQSRDPKDSAVISRTGNKRGASLSSSRKKLKQKIEDTDAAGIGSPKRNSAACSSTTSGVPPPSEALAATAANKFTVTLQDWTEMHEFEAWLKTSEAMRIRKENIDSDREILKNLLVQPPTRATLQAAGAGLQVHRKKQSLDRWQYHCVQEALQRFRRWRKGGMSNWARQGPQPAGLDTRDEPATNLPTVTDMSQRPTYWWKTVLTQTIRRCTDLQTKHPELLTEDAWSTLLAWLQIVLQCATQAAIKRIFATHKDLVTASAVHRCYRAPRIARAVCSPEEIDTRVEKQSIVLADGIIHYNFSCFLVNEVEWLQSRSENLEAMADSASTVHIFGVKPPDAMSPTGADAPHTPPIGAKPPEDQSASTAPETQLGIPLLPSITQKPTPQRSISRKNKQSQRDFLDMCRARPHNLPYTAFQEQTETLDASVSQDLRHLTLIDMKGCSYQQLPLSNTQLFNVIQLHALHSSHACETELEFIQAAQQRLHEFAIHPDNAYGGIRFLGMQRSDVEAVQAATTRMVDELVKLLGDNELGHVWATWHPHRFASVAAYVHVFTTDPADTASQWNWMVDPKIMYIPIDQIQSLPKLASHCPPSPEMLGVDTVPPRVEGTYTEPPHVPETAGQAIATPPVVCELCHKGFRCKEDLHSHCKFVHGDFVEYRKHVFWKAQKHGLYPLEWWQKRSILGAHAFFQRFSIPGANVNDFCRRIDEAVPRRMEACAICAVKDWIEHRTPVYLFAKPDGRRSRFHFQTSEQGTEECSHVQGSEAEEADNSSGASPPSASNIWHTKNGHLCIAEPGEVDKILGVQHYIAAWPQIPSEELHASSVQHPHHPSMRWLLHSRRVPKHDVQFNNCTGADGATASQETGHGVRPPVRMPRCAGAGEEDATQFNNFSGADGTTASQEADHGVRPPVHMPRCAGVGKEEETVWACFECAQKLCKERPEMPPLALANWMWLGRVHHLFRDLTLAMRLLLGLGRPVMRSLYLGRGPRDEVHRGLQGNTMIVAQPSATYKQVVPDVNHILSGLNVIFCKTVDDVSHASILMVQPEQYAPAMRRRILVCPTFANVQLDEQVVARDLPTTGVPPAFVDHAVHLPETTTMRTTMDGPASRHSQFGPNPEEETDEDADEDGTDNNNTNANDAHADEATISRQEDHTNDFETVIGVDTASEEPEVHLFMTMKAKLDLLTSEAQKLARVRRACHHPGEASTSRVCLACHHPGEASTSRVCPACHHPGDTAPTKEVAAQEQCRRIVVDLQDVAKRLNKTQAHRLDVLATGHVHPGVEALAVPTGAPMSTFHAATLPAAYVEFQFGDCTPFLNRPRKIACKDIFAALPWREELEYHLESDNPTDPYVAPARSRFDDPEFVALFADILRRMATNQSVSAALRREGFERDEKAIASVSSEALLQSTFNIVGEGGAVQPRTKASGAVETALRNLMFSTATVPLTDGHKMRLRHIGHAMNIIFGPLTTFSTHNFPDTYSPLLRALCEGAEMPTEEEPTMPTLQEMHRMSAASPASTASLWLLRQQLAYRHFYGMDHVHIGKHYLRTCDVVALREDNLASSGTAGLAGFGESSLCPGEAQQRGFEHGHDKKTSIPKGHYLQYEDLKSLCQTCKLVGDSDAPPLATTESTMLATMEKYNQRLIPYVISRQYESSVLPGRQTGIALPDSPFSARQQRQSRYDGEYEINNTTKRDLVPVVEEEPGAHIAREARRAAAGQRPPANAFSQVPLTGNSLTLLPAYQLLQNIGQPHRIIRQGELSDEPGPRRATTLGDACCFSNDGTFQHFLVPCEDTGQRRKATFQDLLEDAVKYEEAFAHDFRWLSGHNHNHTCAATCIKKMKKSTMEEKKKVLKSNRAPPCRFWFLHVVIFTIVDGAKDRDGSCRVMQVHAKNIACRPFLCCVMPMNITCLHPYCLDPG